MPQQQALVIASSSEQFSASALTERERPARRRVGRQLLYVGLVGVGLVALAALSRTGGGPSPRTENNLPAPDPTLQVGQKSSYLAGQKLAVTPKQSESGDAAVPPRAELTPATVVPPATHLQEEPVVKNTPDKPKTEQPQQRPGSMSRKLGAAACAATMACASAPVRHLPPNEPCPPETIAFMKKNGIGGSKSAYLTDKNYSTPAPVKEGPVRLGLASGWPRELELSGGSVIGQLFFGPDGRVYGYLYSLVSRKGAVYPYCGVIQDKGDLKYGTPAVGEMTDTARIDPVVGVTTVHEFFATF